MVSVPDSLPARKEILKKTPLYKGGDLLIDIGCASGYFEVDLAPYYKRIVAFAPLEKEIALARKFTKHLKNVEIYQSRFIDFDFKDMQADVVFLGNCIHYIFMEYYGYSFIDKLLKISKNYLIIEYIYDYEMNSEDTRIFKDNLQKLQLDKIYSEKNLKFMLSDYFTIEQEIHSASPTRKILILKRK